jgi:predicted transcriptional regulator of viral defense system
MAKGTYISEHLNRSQIEFLQTLNDHEVEYFSLGDIEDQLGVSVSAVSEVVENLASKGFLQRIERGKYTRPNFKDPYVLGTFITPVESAIAYWSALHLHGLTDRFPDRILVKTTTRKKSKQIFGVNYQFVAVRKDRFVGVTTSGYGDNRYPITDREMTLIDCFDQPRYAGGLPELIRAFGLVELDQGKLITYTRTLGNISLIKRLGYLIELMERPRLRRFISFAQSQVNPRYVLFDPLGREEGHFNNRWRLRLNVSDDAIREMMNPAY